MLVNDVHSGLNLTEVAGVVRPETVHELARVVGEAAVAGRRVAIAGARHAMGGQQFLKGETLLDLRGLDRVIAMDHERGLVTAEAGIQWPALIDAVLRMQREAFPGRPAKWGIRQKQTGADTLTLGGAAAANVHGRGLLMAPFAADIEAFTLVSPRGEVMECRRETTPELFACVLGGYGMFGPIATLTLRMTERRPLRRVVRVIDIEDAVHAAQRRIDEGFTFGDFQFDVDPESPSFLTKGVFSCYQPLGSEAGPAADAAEVGGAGGATGRRELRAEDWTELLVLAHTHKKEAFTRYAQHYLATDGQLYWSDTHQLGVYLDGYHAEVDRRLGAKCPGGEMITELYVPPERLVDFLKAAAAMLARRGAQVIYGTIRLIQPDEDTMLKWARGVRACVIFNIHVDHNAAAKAAAGEAFRDLIDLALKRGGSFYLTYHRFATREQVLTAYPELPEFAARKRAWDPEGVFGSDWWGWVEGMVGAEQPVCG